MTWTDYAVLAIAAVTGAAWATVAFWCLHQASRMEDE